MPSSKECTSFRAPTFSSERPLASGELRALALSISRRYAWRAASDALEDCVVEAEILLWRNRDKILSLPSTHARAYSLACVRSAVQHIRERETRQSLLAVALEDLRTAEGDVIELSDSDTRDLIDLAVAGLLDCITSEAIVAALRQLPPDAITVLNLSILDQLPVADIAYRTGWTPAAVRKRYQRAIRRLRELLVDERNSNSRRDELRR